MCVHTRARHEDAHSILCIQTRTPVGPSARARTHWHSHRRAHTCNFRFRVLCRAGGVVKSQGPSPTPDVRTSVPERCLECVYVCARDTRLDPLPLCHLPPALTAEHPPIPTPGSAASLPEKPRGAEFGATSDSGWDLRMGFEAGTCRGPPAPQNAISSRELLRLSGGATDWHPGSRQRVARARPSYTSDSPGVRRPGLGAWFSRRRRRREPILGRSKMGQKVRAGEQLSK